MEKHHGHYGNTINPKGTVGSNLSSHKMNFCPRQLTSSHYFYTMPSPPKLSLLELAELSMASSMLIFLLADLRILSATGRIRTKYEHLSVHNDTSQRASAHDFAGYDDRSDEQASRGVTAGHLMAVLLLEITREADEMASNKDMESALLERLDGNDATAFIFGKQDVRLASGMPALLHCYNEMVAADIATDTHKVSKKEYPMNPEQCPPRSLRRSDFDPNVVDEEEEDLFNSFFAKSRKSIMRPFEEVTAPLRNHDIQDMASVQDHMVSNVASSEGESGCHHNKEELMNLMEKAIEDRDINRLGFMKDFFKNGSICKVLVESKAEMVWLSDWHEAHECTWAISIDREKREVLLCFRGAYTKSDWAHAFDTKDTATSNPIKEDYPKKSKNIRLHSGFHKYLFRVRKDTNTTKYDEIVSKLMHYSTLIGEGVKIRVTGHSLGGALATIFSLYASTDDRFTANGSAIETVTFGAPHVGGYKFADAVRHQEDVGKLRIAKFIISGDGVTSLPPTLFSMSKRGAKYFHSGISVTLPMVRKGGFKLFGQPQPKLKYNSPRKSFVKSMARQVREFYLWNIPVRFWKIAYMHSLVEHKKRLVLTKDDSPLVKYSLQELYKMRNELK
jgi:hypothetical protein